MNKPIPLGLASGLLILPHTLYASTWMKTYGGAKNDVGYGVTQTADGGYITTGKTYSYGAGNADMWLVKTDDFGNVDWTKAYGGSLKIYDLTGRLVKIFNHLTNQPFNQITWDGKDNQGIRVPGGSYFIKLQSGKHSSVKKAIVIH